MNKIVNYPELTNPDERTEKAITIFHEIARGVEKYDWRIALLSGFAIDAHFGYLTKNHKDVDLIVSKSQAVEIARYLEDLGHNVYEVEKFAGEVLKVDQAEPDRETRAHADIHYFWEEKEKVVIPLLGKKLTLSGSFDTITETKAFLGKRILVLKPEFLLEEKRGWCEQIGLPQCREQPNVYNQDLEKINFLQQENKKRSK